MRDDLKHSLSAFDPKRPIRDGSRRALGVQPNCENDEAASLQPLVPGMGDYFAAAGKAGSLPMSRRSCWMITVALRFAAIFFIRSIDATVCARS